MRGERWGTNLDIPPRYGAPMLYHLPFLLPESTDIDCFAAKPHQRLARQTKVLNILLLRSRAHCVPNLKQKQHERDVTSRVPLGKPAPTISTGVAALICCTV